MGDDRQRDGVYDVGGKVPVWGYHVDIHEKRKRLLALISDGGCGDVIEL